ncbi:MAG: transcriptional regulator [Gammaproteobacteria bacterium]|nr:transcriptional regulator [Gammaproteobacteria bacterium]MXY51272.1 transcriptional regulator [Gammaproteobacteria bacterium]MYB38898.1 transcriptional regulator [Gammaproteobacteria bacterium]
MALLSLTTAADVQRELAASVRQRRRSRKLSRRALAERSTVPAATIKRFETTGQISLRQFVLLWQCVGDLDQLASLAEPRAAPPRTIDEVLEQEPGRGAR